jgi:hypothetical protein
MTSRYLIETSATDGYLIEDGTGVLLLEGTDATPPIIPPVFPNPVQGKSVVQGFVSANLLAIGLLTQDAIFREPTYAPRTPPKPVQVQVVPNLLTTTLAAQAAPFKQTNWPNPTKAVENRQGWTEPLKLPLYGKDQFFGAPGQPPANTDWPVPRGAQQPQTSQPQNLQQTTLAKPFVPVAWVNPVPRAAVLSHVGPNLLGTTLASPFSQLNWPNPLVRIQPQGQQPSDLLLTTLAVQAAPFRAIEWPNPQAKRLTIEQPAVNLLVTTLAQPFRVTVWPNPQPAKLILPQQAGNLLVTTLAVQQMPFSQHEWPVPRSLSGGIQSVIYGTSRVVLGVGQPFAAGGLCAIGPRFTGQVETGQRFDGVVYVGFQFDGGVLIEPQFSGEAEVQPRFTGSARVGE